MMELVEEMAKNVHDVWAKTRMEQGWTYGEMRNDAMKHHPCLVEYEELPFVLDVQKAMEDKLAAMKLSDVLDDLQKLM